MQPNEVITKAKDLERKYGVGQVVVAYINGHWRYYEFVRGMFVGLPPMLNEIDIKEIPTTTISKLVGKGLLVGPLQLHTPIIEGRPQSCTVIVYRIVTDLNLGR
jgi:hypothetical protein